MDPRSRAPRRRTDTVPTIPDEIQPDQLDGDIARQLRTLPKGLAEEVARRLVVAGLLLAEDPETAHLHAMEATRIASRVAAVREATGVTAYATGRWAQALAELRAARRMSGSDDFLPIMADCERGLGRPERALTLAGSPEAARLDAAGRIEMRIVASGARRDLGQLDAAVLTLKCSELKDARAPWAARLRYAYADALEAVDDRVGALEWFSKAAAADPHGETEAAERLADLQGVVFEDSFDEEDQEDSDLQAQTSVARSVPEPAPIAPDLTVPDLTVPDATDEIVAAPSSGPATLQPVQFEAPPEPQPVTASPQAEMLALVFEAEPTTTTDGHPADQVGEPSAE